MRDELGNRMADEHVSQLNLFPEEAPNVCLWRSLNGDEITSNLDVGSVEDGSVRGDLLDQGNQTGHLRVINLSFASAPVLLTK